MVNHYAKPNTEHPKYAVRHGRVGKRIPRANGSEARLIFSRAVLGAAVFQTILDRETDYHDVVNPAQLELRDSR